jgi:hypothetical protein
MTPKRQFGWLFWLSALTASVLLFLGMISGFIAMFFHPVELFREITRGPWDAENIQILGCGFVLLWLFLTCCVYCFRAIYRSK